MKRTILLAWAALGAVLPLSGCALAAYGVGMAAITEDMKQREREDYASYRKKADAENASLVQKGRAPEPVLSIKQWRAAEGR